MKVSVDEKLKQVYLAAAGKWVPAVAHVINVGDYSFSIIAQDSETLRISELTSGALLINYDLKGNSSNAIGADKDILLAFYEIVVGGLIESIIEKAPILMAENVARAVEKYTAMNGPMPEIEDAEWMLADENEKLN